MREAAVPRVPARGTASSILAGNPPYRHPLPGYAGTVKIKKQRRGVSTGEKIRQLMIGDQGSPVSGRSKLAQRVEDAREAKRRLSRSRRGR